MAPITPRSPRRRGQVLLRAIFDATLAELTESGYAGLTMEAVAARARTSKSSLYLRWPTRAELVVAAIQHTSTDDAELPPDSGDLRTDLLALLRRMADRLAGPFGEAVWGLMTETLTNPARTQAARAAATGARNRRLRQLLQRAADRGEVQPDALTGWVVEVAPVLLAHYFLTPRGAHPRPGSHRDRRRGRPAATAHAAPGVTPDRITPGRSQPVAAPPVPIVTPVRFSAKGRTSILGSQARPRCRRSQGNRRLEGLGDQLTEPRRME
jgi:AcrR family transcriptional regulator